MYGRLEGRIIHQSSVHTREEKIFSNLKKEGSGLEIGPSHNPIAPKKKGYNVHILDHAPAQELKAKFSGHGVNTDNIEEVDFVWNGEPLPEIVGNHNCYDWIIASHVIEHVPDFVSFLQQCSALLKDDGVLSLAIPDKRYCFDYFSSVSSTGDVLDAFFEKRKRPSTGQVFNHVANAARRSGQIAWAKDSNGGADQLIHSVTEAIAQYNLSRQSTQYIDVHCWRFTPRSFHLLISDLLDLKLINLSILSSYETVGCEFHISLSKRTTENNSSITRLHCLKLIKEENK